MYLIYKITDNTNNNIYIGQTKKNLSLRISGHISNYNCNRGYCSSKNIIKNNDFNVNILCKVETKEEADKIEREYIKNTPNCINKIKYDMLSKKDYDIIYREKNKDKLNKHKTFKYNFIKSWGGDPRTNNNLLKIDVNLFRL